jgi:hypothetical protein
MCLHPPIGSFEVIVHNEYSIEMFPNLKSFLTSLDLSGPNLQEPRNNELPRGSRAHPVFLHGRSGHQARRPNFLYFSHFSEKNSRLDLKKF